MAGFRRSEVEGGGAVTQGEGRSLKGEQWRPQRGRQVKIPTASQTNPYMLQGTEIWAAIENQNPDPIEVQKAVQLGDPTGSRYVTHLHLAHMRAGPK